MRSSIHRSRRLRTALFIALVLSVVLLPAPAAPASDAPPAAFIADVPLYQQVQAHGCGAAALQMVLDYWGPFVDQRAVYDAARTKRGSSLQDLTRAAQFSAQSRAQGGFFPPFAGLGYPGRPLGYAAFFYASDEGEDWLEGLKTVVAQGYPVIVLTDWFPGVYGPHYRVVTGYDDEAGVIYLNDPWARELKRYFDYQGSPAQFSASGDARGEYAGYAWSEEDFLAVWKLSTERWGLAGQGKAFGAVFAAPWTVAVDAPDRVAPGEEFEVRVAATYPCPAPFGSGGFPAFPARDGRVALSLPEGVTVVSGDGAVGTVAAGATVSAVFTVRAPAAAGAFTIAAVASGEVSGSLGPWRTYPAYDYADRIGGTGAADVLVAR